MTLEIVRVPVLSDNYAWLIHDDASGETVAVDPGGCNLQSSNSAIEL